MKLVADAWFTAGRRHAACEDAAAVADDGALAVVCDGCSSSAQTHLGAQLLARGAVLGHGVDRVDAWRASLQLPVEALDATRLTAQSDGGQVTVTVAGDGGLAVRDRHTGALRWWRVVCPSGAPPYPAYAAHPARLAGWRDAFGDAREVHAETPGGSAEVTSAPGFDPLTWRFDWADIDLVALFSDGVEQVRQPAHTATSRAYAPVPVAEVLGELLAIPFAHGRFAYRRARRAVDRWHALGWRLMDDLSVAMVACPDPPE